MWEYDYLKFPLEYTVFVKFHGNYSKKHLFLLLLLVSYSAYSINQNCLTVVPYSSTYLSEPIIDLTYIDDQQRGREGNNYLTSGYII